LKNILRYKSTRTMDKPLVQMVIAGAVFGLVLYFVLIQVFKKAIIRMIGELTLKPNES